MLLPQLSDQLPEMVQAVRQVVVQAKHHPEFLNPVPGGHKLYNMTSAKETIKDSFLKWVNILTLKLT